MNTSHPGRLRRLAVAVALAASAVVAAQAPAAATTTYYNIYSDKNFNNCIGPAGDAQGDANAWAVDCLPGDSAQQWYWGASITIRGSVFRKLINFGSNHCLGVAGGSTALNAKIVSWACNTSEDQYWAMDSNGSPDLGHLWYLLNAKAFDLNSTAQVVGISGGSGLADTQLVLWSRITGINGIDQLWEWVPA